MEGKKWTYAVRLPREGNACSEPEGGGHSVSSFVVGWGGGASARHDTIEVPAALAEAHGLRPSLKVRVRAVELPRVTSLWVCPESEADWAAAQQHASALQSEVLMQVFAANVGHEYDILIVHGWNVKHVG